MNADASWMTLPALAMPVANVPSQTQPGLSYAVSLADCTCTCENFRERRAQFPARDIRTACKHLQRQLATYPDALHPYARLLVLSHAGGIFPFDGWAVLSRAYEPILITGSRGSDWLDVMMWHDRRYQRFGYNPSERRWSYDHKPTPYAREIGDTLRSITLVPVQGRGLLRALAARFGF